MPTVVFTDPQVAAVGLTEGEAKDKVYDVKTSVITLDNVPRHIVARDTRGLIKLVADRRTDGPDSRNPTSRGYGLAAISTPFVET